MSGICGIVLKNIHERLVSEELLSMVKAMGLMGQSEELTDNMGSVGFGAQKFQGRITGINRITKNQLPLSIVLHGSLYNLRELLTLEEQSSDFTKGLLRLYIKEGMGFLNRLRGEFVLAIWDGNKETLYLATDRFRVHPLLYYQDSDKIIFASRMKGILACPLPVKRTINLEAIVDVVGSSVIPTPKTIFMEIKKLPPGHILTYKKGNIKLEPYWDINFLRPSNSGESELAQKLKTCLTNAHSIRLDIDAKSDHFGTFLSGGVDSSSVTGILSQLYKHPVKCFSIGFDEQRFNEINYARITAQAFGAEHHEYFVSAKDTYNTIPIIIEEFDEPCGNSSAIPTYFCAKIAKECGVNTLYAGDGGDELFAGNERYATQRIFEYYHLIPAWLRKVLVKPLVFTIADILKRDMFIKGKKYIQRANIPPHKRISSYGIFNVISMTELFEKSFLESMGKNLDHSELISFYFFNAPAKNNLDRQLYIDLKLAISDNDLFKVMRMTEAAGVNVRFPFLDHQLAEFAATVPAHIKMRGLNLRSFFKKAYEDMLPLEVRTKIKHGFGLPIPVWLRSDKQLNEMMHDLVLSSRSIQRGYFQKKALEDIVEKHSCDKTSFYGTVLWNLMVLELWHRRYIG